MRAAKVQAGLYICAVSIEPSLFALAISTNICAGFIRSLCQLSKQYLFVSTCLL